jgi:cobalamin biosynthesis protein CobT
MATKLKAEKIQGPLERIAAAMSQNWGVQIEFTGFECCTDGNVIKLPVNSDYLDPEQWKLAHSNLDHEVCHVAEEMEASRLGRVSPLTMMRAAEPTLKMWFNVFEDIRIEKKYSRKYPGMAENMAYGNVWAAKEHAKTGFGGNFHHALGCLVIAKTRLAPGEFAVPPEYGPWLELIGNEVQQASDWFADGRNVEAESALKLAHAVMDRLAAAADKAVHAAPDCGGLVVPRTGKGVTLSTGSAFEVDLRAKSATYVTTAAGCEARKSERYVPDPASKREDRWISPGEESAPKEYKIANRDVASKSYGETLALVQDQIATLRSKLLGVIRIASHSKVAGDKEVGDLDESALHRLRSGDSRVFSHKTEGLNLDLAVSILIDLSGSTGGREVPGTCSYFSHATTIALAETLDRLGVAFEIIGWHNNYARLATSRRAEYVDRYAFDYLVFKGFNEKLRVCRHRFCFITAMDDNADGEAVLEVGKRLAARKEARKIMFVLSDGEPACGVIPCDVLENHLKEAVSTLTRSGIEVLGVGCGTRSVKKYYNEGTGAAHLVVDRLDKLAQVIYGEMSKRILPVRARRAS